MSTCPPTLAPPQPPESADAMAIKALAGNVAALSTAIVGLVKAGGRLDAALAAGETTLTGLQAIVTSLQADLAQAQADIAGLKSQVAAVNASPLLLGDPPKA